MLELQIRHGHWALQHWRSCGCSEWQGRWLVGDAEASRLLPFDEAVEEEANQDGQGGGARESQVQRVYSFQPETPLLANSSASCRGLGGFAHVIAVPTGRQQLAWVVKAGLPPSIG